MSFLEDNPLMSPSKIFQVALTNIIEQHKISRDDLNRARLQAERMQKMLQEATEFITIKGQWEEFQKKYG